MEIRKTALPGVLVLQPIVHQDARGYLFESLRADVLTAAGLPSFVQENQSLSVAGTLRGLHYQLARPQAKLVRVVRGAILDVAVDIRRGSPSFGRWHSELLTAENKLQLFIPPGFAHGFCVPVDLNGAEGAEVLYKCDDYYSGPVDQKGVIWNDPSLAIEWLCADPIVSPKDRQLPVLRRDSQDLPVFPVSVGAPVP